MDQKNIIIALVLGLVAGWLASFVVGGYGIVHDVPAIGRYEDPIITNPA